MTVTPRGADHADEDDCDTILALKAEGKVQNVPETCAAAAPAAAVAKARSK